MSLQKHAVARVKAGRVKGVLVQSAHKAFFESLELRRLLTTVSWVNEAGGRWADAANWSGGQVPGAGNDVVIDVAGDPIIEIDGAVPTVRSVVNREVVRLRSGGAAELKATNSIRNEALLVMDATASGGSARVEVTQGTLTNAETGFLFVTRGGGGTRTVAASVENLGQITVQSGVELAVSNAGRSVTLASGVVRADGSVRISGGTVNVRGGELAGTIVVNNSTVETFNSMVAPAVLQITGATNVLRNHSAAAVTLMLAGTGTEDTVVTTAAGASNSGRILLGSTSATRATRLVAGNGFVNTSAGVIQTVAGSSGARSVTGGFVNAGTLDARLARLEVTDAYTHEGGALIGDVRLRNVALSFESGVVDPVALRLFGETNTVADDVPAGATVWLVGDADASAKLWSFEGLTNFGTIRLETTRSDRSATLEVSGGALVNARGALMDAIGVGTQHRLVGDVVNEGLVVLRAGKQVGITGSFTQSASGVLRSEMTASNNVGRLAVSGNSGLASLGGALEIQRLQGFVPAAGSEITVLTAVSTERSFASLLGGTLTATTELTIRYVGSTVAVRAGLFDQTRTLTVGTPAVGQLQQAGEVDRWTFFGRSGRLLSLIANPGSSATPGTLQPPAPALQWAQVTIFDPDGVRLVSANASSAGQLMSILRISLPADGVYQVEIAAASGQSSRTGGYSIAAYDVTTDVAPLLLNRQTTGIIQSPFNTDEWTFSLNAGQQIRLDLLNASTSGLQFTLEGPNGYRPFVNISSDSDPITVEPNRAGPYRLMVAGSADQVGSYSFVIEETTRIDLPLGIAVDGQLASTGAAVLYRIVAPGGTPLLVSLDHTNSSDRTEVYLRRGSPPTRGVFDARFESIGADHNVLVSSAPDGEWYALVYGDRVSGPAGYTIRATASDVYLLDSTPDEIGVGNTLSMTLIGAGFLPGLTAELIRDGRVILASSVDVDSYERLTALFDLSGAALGEYDVRVRAASGQSDTLPRALKVTAAGSGLLNTRLIVPPALARTGPATLLIEYSNTGNAPLAAPLIQLRSADPDDSDRPIFTLDESRLVEGIWASTMPDGFSHSVAFLGSGQQPGILNPGERVQVPVYFAGLLEPWDLGDTRIELGLSVAEADDTRAMNWFGMTHVLAEVEPPIRNGPASAGHGGETSYTGVFNWPFLDIAWRDSIPPTNSQVSVIASSTLPTGLRLTGIRWDEPGVLQLRPDSVSPGAWSAVVDNLRANVGETLGDWIRVLSENAQFLARSGIVTNDLSDLWGFEVMQAMGSLGPVSTLDAVTDATMPVPGIDLSLSRSFANGITSRYTSGPFGQGWNMGWDLLLTEEAGPTPQLRGSVVLSTSTGLRRVFEPDSRDVLGRKYFSPVGDSSTLTKLSSGLFELRDQNGAITRFRADGRIDYVQDTNGNRVTTTFDTGRLTALTHSSGASITLTYNAAGRITQVVDSAGRATTYTYDPTNTYLLTVTTHDGKVTTYTYNQTGSPQVLHALRSITRGGTTQFFSYDAQGRLDDTFRGNNQQFIDFVYDSAGTVSVVDAAGTTRLFYESNGLLARITDPLGNTTVSRFDENYRLEAIIAPTGESQSFTWCACGSLTSITDELGNRTSFSYDNPFRRMTSFTDAMGRTTRYTYDTRGNLQQTIYPNGSIESLGGYDAQGLPASFTNRRGQAQSYTYTPTGQVDRQTFADGSYADFDYDIRGNLILVTEVGPGGTGTPKVTTYTYDYANDGDRLKRMTDAEGRWLEYTYDTFGRRTAMTDSTGAVTRYEYDSAGRLHRLRDGANTLLVTYSYDAAGRLSRVDKGNGTFSTYAYDAAGQLLSLVNHRNTSTINSRFDYTYDARGRRTSMATLDGTWTYTYDATGQLTRAVFASLNTAVIPNQDLQYVYDAVGNRIRTILNGVTTEYTTNNLNQYTNVGGQAYTYDADGNLTFDGQRTYVYDQQNRLTRVTGPAGVTEYEYDALGNRTATIHNGVRTEYLLDPTGLVDVTAEFDGSGNLTARNVHGLGLLGRSIAGGALNYFDFDAIGSTAGVTGAAGQMLNRYVYEPFGGTLRNTESFANAFHFVGQYGLQQDRSGIHYVRARFYTADDGRFLSTDPIGILGGLNLYGYVENSPTNLVDTTGLFPVPIWLPLIIPPLVLALCSVNAIVSVVPGLGGGGGGGGGGFCSPGSPGDQGGNSSPGLPPGEILGPFAPGPGDPNDKRGPLGVGAANYVRGDATLPYRIRFENIGPASINAATNEPFPPSQWATAPAQRVTILDQLSPLLDWTTFRLTELGFGDTIISIPPGRTYYEGITSITINSRSFTVEMMAGIDLETGRVYASYQSLDPNTGLPPDVLTGFLPPEDGTGIGMGYFAFTIQPVAGLATGTEIRNVALISFDGLPVIATNQLDPFDPTSARPDREALVTIDATPPVLVSAPEFVFYSRPHVVQLRFSEDVGASLSSDDIEIVHLTTGASIARAMYDVAYDTETQTATLFFRTIANAGIEGLLPDGQYRLTVKASGVTDAVGNRMAQDVSHEFSFLLGDIDGDGQVIQFNDLLIMAQNYGRNDPNVGYRDGDIDNDGAVGFSDLLVIAQRYGLSVFTPRVVESRFDYTGNAQGIELQFSVPVDSSFETNDLLLTNLTTGQAIAAAALSITAAGGGGYRVTWPSLNGGVLADGNYRLTVRAAGISGAGGIPMPADHVLDFRFLAGDLNGDGSVGFADLLTVAQNYGQTGRTFSQGNLDYSPDGLVGFSDLLILAQRYGTSLIRSEPKPSVFGSRSIGRRGLFEAEEVVMI